MERIADAVGSERELELRLRLAQWRRSQRLVQHVVAKRMGTSQSAVSDIERGRDCTRETFHRYVEALGLQLEETLWIPENPGIKPQPRRPLGEK